MKRISGFTLIELVVAIVILGILSVVAAPKFLGLQSDARAAALKGLSGDNSDWKQLGAHTEAVPNEVIVYSFENAQENETCVVIYRSNASAGAPTILSSEADLC